MQIFPCKTPNCDAFVEFEITVVSANHNLIKSFSEETIHLTSSDDAPSHNPIDIQIKDKINKDQMVQTTQLHYNNNIVPLTDRKKFYLTCPKEHTNIYFIELGR